MCQFSRTQVAGPSRPTAIAMPPASAFSKMHRPAYVDEAETPALSPSLVVEGDSYFSHPLIPRRPSSPFSSGLQTPVATLVAGSSTPVSKPVSSEQAPQQKRPREVTLKQLEYHLEELGLGIDDVPEDVLELLVAAAELGDDGETLRLHLENLGEVLGEMM